MARYGQRRCRCCGELGHNRATCPDISDERKAQRKQAIANHREMYGRAKVGSNRKCSQCGEKGHNRKTCSEYKRLGVLASDLILRQAEITRKLMNKHGITVGGLIVTSSTKYEAGRGNYDQTVEPVETTHIITAIEWGNFTPGEADDNLSGMIKTKRLGKPEVTGKFEDGTERPVQVNETSYERLRLTQLAGLTLEQYREVAETNYVYQGSIYTDCVHTPETKALAMAEWKSEMNSKSFDDNYKTNQMARLDRDTNQTLMILPGCTPIKKLSNKVKKELTLGRGYERMYIDGERNKPFNKSRIEKIERFVNYLEKLVK